MRLVILILLAACECGCRGDLDGEWAGDIGVCPPQAGGASKLDLEQSGAVLDGEVCRCGACGFITSGHIEDDDVTIDYGCATCTLPATTLELNLHEGNDLLEGDGWMNDCDCADEDCACRMTVRLRRR